MQTAVSPIKTVSGMGGSDRWSKVTSTFMGVYEAPREHIDKIQHDIAAASVR